MNDRYKHQHKPVQNSDNVKFHQGYYYPVNKEKCLTQENIFRSSWEQFFMYWCDMNPAIIRWASEPIGIKYMNPVANRDYCNKNGLNPMDPHNWKLCTYYTDFWIEISDGNGGTRKIFIEIKPKSQTECPKPISESATLKEHKQYNRDAETFLVNQAKWAAAKRYFEERGAEFSVWTENKLKELKKKMHLK